MGAVCFLQPTGWRRSRRRETVPIVCSHCLAIDLGTGGAKAVLVDEDTGCLTRSSACAYQTYVPRDGWVEQRPSEWWTATKHAIRDLMRMIDENEHASLDVTAISVTGQMQDLILLDPDSGQASHDSAILYSDQRATSEATELTKRLGRTIGSDSLMAKMLWVDRNWDNTVTTSAIGAADFIVWKMSGAHVTDPTTASVSALTVPLSGHEYDDVLLDRGGLSHWRRSLPRILAHNLSRSCGNLSAEAASELAVAKLRGVQIVHAGGDLATATIGAASAAPGSSYMYIGTSGWVAGTALAVAAKQGHCGEEADECESSSTVFRVAHPEVALEIRAASVMTAGGCVAWIRALLNLEWEDLHSLAASAEIGSSGVRFLPYLAGERCPFRDKDARGVFTGLGMSTGRGEMVRAVMEGVAFNLFLALQELEAYKGARGEICVSDPLVLIGGAGRSPLWCEILASVLGRTIHVPTGAASAGARGAAAIAIAALGKRSSLELPAEWQNLDAVYPPTHEHTYRTLFQQWIQSDPRLRRKLSELT